jgi:hypothetical protein
LHPAELYTEKFRYFCSGQKIYDVFVWHELLTRLEIENVLVILKTARAHGDTFFPVFVGKTVIFLRENEASC